MKTKVQTAVAAFLMLLCLCAGAWAAEAPVVDMADLFSAEEEAVLTQMIEDFREKNQMDFAIITTDAAHNSTQQEIADELYDRGGYGVGEEASGILYYIDMYERIPYLCTTGEMIDYMTDERIDAAHESCYSYLAGGSYGRAAMRMIEVVQEYVNRGIPEGQYRYDVITGQRLTARHNVLTGMEILVSAVIAAVAALAFMGSVKGTYGLKGSTYEYHFRENCDLTITNMQDDYLRTTTTRTRKPEHSPSSGGGGSHHGGSGVHTSSSGRSHGGGAGRKF